LIKKEPGITDLPLHAEIIDLQTDIDVIEKDAALYEEKNFDKRMEVVDFLEFHVIDRLKELLQKTAQPTQLISLKYRAEKIKIELEEIDVILFEKLRAKIRTGEYTGQVFKNLIHEYTHFYSEDNAHQEEPGYDNLDLFINALFPSRAIPEQARDLEPEMVYYQKTPVRIVFELVEKAHFVKEAIFVDLGSGLGQAAILVNLLAGIKAKGVEFEPAFCDYARHCAEELNLSNVTFINADARKADYSEGTVFFMFTPFRGDMLQEVLAILRREALQRKIKVITYGPCTAQIALQTWLHFETPETDNIYKLAVFASL